MIDLLGYAGALALFAAYALVTRRGPSQPVHVLNLFGAVAIVANGSYHGAYPSVALNVAWLFLAVYGLVKLRGLRGAAAHPPPPHRLPASGLAADQPGSTHERVGE